MCEPLNGGSTERSSDETPELLLEPTSNFALVVPLIQLEKDEEKNRVHKGIAWFDDYTYSLAYYGEELISLLVTQLWYAGGAHSNTNYESANFSITGGKAVSLKLADLFLPQAAYIEVLSAYCIDDLRKQEGASVKSGHIQPFNEDDLSVFFILPARHRVQL